MLPKPEEIMSYQVYYSFQDSPHNTLVDINQIADSADTLDWGIYESLEDVYYPSNNEIVTQNLITEILRYKCNSPLTEAKRINILNKNEGKYIYLIYRRLNNV